jgi:hypothetical protein
MVSQHQVIAQDLIAALDCDHTRTVPKILREGCTNSHNIRLLARSPCL